MCPVPLVLFPGVAAGPEFGTGAFLVVAPEPARVSAAQS